MRLRRRSGTSDAHPQIEIAMPSDVAMFVRQAISEALHKLPWLFDDYQREALIAVENGLCEAVDQALRKSP